VLCLPSTPKGSEGDIIENMVSEHYYIRRTLTGNAISKLMLQLL
jgi:hypothetical protein